VLLNLHKHTPCRRDRGDKQELLPRDGRDGTNVSLHDFNSGTPREDVSGKHPGRAKLMSKLARGIHETSKYMLYNNKPRAQ
jgi:hypothetical protein